MGPTVSEERCRCSSGLSGPVVAVVMGLCPSKKVPSSAYLSYKLVSAKTDRVCSNPAAGPNLIETVPLRNHMPPDQLNWIS